MSPASLLKFTDLDPRVQKHLTRVYATLTLALVVAALGTTANLVLHIGGWLTTLAAFGSLMWLVMTPATPANLNKRYGLLGAFAFCQGTAIGPLIGMALDVNPAIVLTAVLGTSLVFGCFSAAALTTRRRSYLFLGGYLSSAITGFMALRLASWAFGGSVFAFNMELYIGLLVFAGYVLFDTQLIVERCAAGSTDHVKHALDLFVDFMAILVRVLIILMKNNEKREQERRRRDKRA